MNVNLRADAMPGALLSVTVTLGAANAVTVVTLPDGSAGFRLFPAGADVRYALNAPPGAAAASALAAVPASAFAAGAVAKADQWETRIMEGASAITLHLRAAVAAAVIDLEVF